MPSLELKTNVSLANPEAFIADFTTFAAKTLNKPVPAVCVSYTHVKHLAFNGTFDPAFLLTITSLYNLNPTVNEEFSKTFFDFFAEQLGVSDDRGYITFYNPGPEYLGHKSTTVAVLRGPEKAQ